MLHNFQNISWSFYFFLWELSVQTHSPFFLKAGSFVFLTLFLVPLIFLIINPLWDIELGKILSLSVGFLKWLFHLLYRNEIVVAPMEIILDNFQKAKSSTIWPSYTIFWHMSQWLDILIHRFISAMFFATLFTVVREWK